MSQRELKKCVFCDPKDRPILIATDNFLVVSCRMSLKEGHLLILAKEHKYSMAELAKTQYDELTALQNRCKAIIYDIWDKKASCGEHGTGLVESEQEQSSASIMHAHRHIAPIDDEAETELLIEAEMKPTTGYSEFNPTKSYIWLEDKHGNQYVTYKPMRKQILRGAIAKGANTESDYVWQNAKTETHKIYKINEANTITKVQKYLKAQNKENVGEDFGLLLKEASKFVGRKQLTEYARCGMVSSALMTDKRSIFTGICLDVRCGIGFCAEQAAIADMLKNNETRIAKIVTTCGKSIFPPCGKCRELIRMVNSENMKTQVMVDNNTVSTIAELLPHAWYAPWKESGEIWR